MVSEVVSRENVDGRENFSRRFFRIPLREQFSNYFTLMVKRAVKQLLQPNLRRRFVGREVYNKEKGA